MVLSRFMGNQVYVFSLISCPGCPMPRKCLGVETPSSAPMLADSNLLAPGEHSQDAADGSIIPIIALCNMSGPQTSRQPTQTLRRRLEGVSLQQQKSLVKWDAKSYFSVVIL